MKGIFTFLLTIYLLFSFSYTQAATIEIISTEEAERLEKEVSREEFFNYYGDYFTKNIPDTYKYINLNFKGVSKDSELYSSLQKLVYLDLIENNDIYIYKNKPINAYVFYKLTEKFFNTSFVDQIGKNELTLRNAKQKDFNFVNTVLENNKYSIDVYGSNSSVIQKKLIFSDVYKTLTTTHFDQDNLDETEMMNSAIQGLAEGTKDKYTVYFPPTENKDFNESLTGEYEGIGAYVDMDTPGEITIVSPIIGSPAEKAGLKGGDVVTHVDGRKIEEGNSLQEAVSWIKGPAGTTVELTIRRNSEVFNVIVTRGNIVIKDIEYEVINSSTFYIQLKFFGPNTFNDFKAALEELQKNKNITKIIFDLRNNPGGYLDQVTNMLSFFVPEGEPTAIVKYRSGNIAYKSEGFDLIDFSKYKLVVLQNSGSASASEIMIGTLKDYFPNATLVGENTFGKGSVQTMREYNDGSSLKYTIAKWFTGGTETGIDNVGIAPDIEVLLDGYITDRNNDPQFKKALEIR
ncbi:MAG: S41 family peptidase [Candidatus Gracilibacteria bacterium]|nr:S41 family peptidase [Candidatus Gracilibacteria bacterium]